LVNVLEGFSLHFRHTEIRKSKGANCEATEYEADLGLQICVSGVEEIRCEKGEDKAS
jgi:hypothetical protein